MHRRRPVVAGEGTHSDGDENTGPRRLTTGHDPGRAEVIAAARSHLPAQLPVRNLPRPPGMSTAAVDRQTALFVWETADRRFCFGYSTTDGGAVMTTCTSSPGNTPFSARPAIVPLVTVGILDQHHVIGADRETVLSVTCNGTPLALRPLPPSSTADAASTPSTFLAGPGDASR
uniref:Uncharacterized protein n=1 Tax=Streptomyces sp. NBC_01393 TaxID=2903851 RepID=A0AAU3I715_9ACTN